MANALRIQVVGEAFRKKPLEVKQPNERPADYFGKRVFNREKMYKYLPKEVYQNSQTVQKHLRYKPELYHRILIQIL